MTKNPAPLKDVLKAEADPKKDGRVVVGIRSMNAERDLTSAVAQLKAGEYGWLESRGERLAKIWGANAGFTSKEARPMTKVPGFIHSGAMKKANTVVAVHATAAGNNYRVMEGGPAIPGRVLAFIAPLDLDVTPFLARAPGTVAKKKEFAPGG